MATQTLPEVLNESSLPLEPALEDMEFVGCDARPMDRETHALGRYEGRVEFYDIATETAWTIRDGGPAHEEPINRLIAMIAMIEAVSGAPIATGGGSGLVRIDHGGRARYVPHPDLSVFLEPGRRLDVGDGYDISNPATRPDVILEVDHTTDVQREKLRVYEAWGLPELWVDVLDASSRNRPAGLKPGLTIRVFEDGAYRPSLVSRAFPGWRPEDIHRGMNEVARSERTCAELERLGRLFGDADGTGPDDDPLMRSLRDQSRDEGHAKGHAEGRIEGRAAGRIEERTSMVRQLLRSRGIAVSPDFPGDAAEFTRASDEALVDAAMHCANESDFLARLRAQ